MKLPGIVHYLIFGIWIVILLFNGRQAIAKPHPFRSPWENNFGTSPHNPPLNEYANQGFLKECFLQAGKFFQVFISPADGDRCPMYPSCSAYAIEAVRTYGVLKGAILTSDRLLRCGREKDYPLILHQQQFHYLDPLKNNVIW